MAPDLPMFVVPVVRKLVVHTPRKTHKLLAIAVNCGPLKILAVQPHGAYVPLLATTRQRTARMRDNGAQRKRSHLLPDATFPIADRASTPMRTSVPYRATEVCAGDSRNPARPRMTSAAKAQSPTAIALAMRSRVGNITCVPPQAARPRGAPRARAAWKIAITANPTKTAIAAAIT